LVKMARCVGERMARFSSLKVGSHLTFGGYVSMPGSDSRIRIHNGHFQSK